MHLHLDLVGGISGDMFISALLDCFPDWADDLEEQIEKAGFPDLVRLRSESFNDGILTGHRFSVAETNSGEKHQHAHSHDHNHDHEHHHHSHDHSHSPSHEHSHDHRHYKEIKALIEASELSSAVQSICIGIFDLIAEAEAQIHNKSIEDVAFHEVGAWDSIADVVCASHLIDKLQITSCSCSKLPLGRGQVKTAHGMLPIPAPATALILKGFEFFDDGLNGERITPTGAGILKFLNPYTEPTRSTGQLTHQGYGFGTKKFPGISNVLRVLLFDSTNSTNKETSHWTTENIHQLEFEIDDQTPEQLAAAIDELRLKNGVLDVAQYSIIGKKNRLATCVRVLSSGTEIEQLITDCFSLTTTLGLRHSQVDRHILNRESSSSSVGDQTYRTKTVQRPDGTTTKVEMDDLKGTTVAKQSEIRQQLESNKKHD